jgi:quinol monooxygenase YgiN
LQSPDGRTYCFLELFADKESVQAHGRSAAFQAMAERQGAADATDKSRKAAFVMGMQPCVSTTRRAVAARAVAKL